MRIQIDALGHTWHLNITAGIYCPAEPDRDTQLDSLVETVGNQPDRRAELDHRVRPDQTLGFRQR